MVNDFLWREYNRMIIPIGPVKQTYSIDTKDAEFLLSKFSKALLVRWTVGIERSHGNLAVNDWYAVVCDEFKHLDDLPAKNRSEIRRGLTHCRVETVDARYIADHGFGVYCSAYERYKAIQQPTMTENEYRAKILSTIPFDDIIHYWAVFHDHDLIAYSVNHLYDKTEVCYFTIKFHPDHLRLYPSYALFYEMNKFYLQGNSYEYVNDGFRSILHQTNIQQYLIDKFNFKKCSANLFVYYRPVLSIALSVTFPMRRHLSKWSPKLASLYTLEEIRQGQEHA
jgi:hypothetical protein